jgi:hypothetical protein
MAEAIGFSSQAMAPRRRAAARASGRVPPKEIDHVEIVDRTGAVLPATMKRTLRDSADWRGEEHVGRGAPPGHFCVWKARTSGGPEGHVVFGWDDEYDPRALFGPQLAVIGAGVSMNEIPGAEDPIQRNHRS